MELWRKLTVCLLDHSVTQRDTLTLFVPVDQKSTYFIKLFIENVSEEEQRYNIELLYDTFIGLKIQSNMCVAIVGYIAKITKYILCCYKSLSQVYI